MEYNIITVPLFNLISPYRSHLQCNIYLPRSQKTKLLFTYTVAIRSRSLWYTWFQQRPYFSKTNNPECLILCLIPEAPSPFNHIIHILIIILGQVHVGDKRQSCYVVERVHISEFESYQGVPFNSFSSPFIMIVLTPSNPPLLCTCMTRLGRLSSPRSCEGRMSLNWNSFSSANAISTAWLNLAGCAVDRATLCIPGAVLADRCAAVALMAECGSRT